MNLYHIQNLESFKKAGSECRSSFIDQIVLEEYDAVKTFDAWHWFYKGWCLAPGITISQEPVKREKHDHL